MSVTLVGSNFSTSSYFNPYFNGFRMSVNIKVSNLARVYKNFNPYFNGFRMSVLLCMGVNGYLIYFNPYFNGFRMSVSFLTRV